MDINTELIKRMKGISDYEKETPEMEIVEFKTRDIITTSGVPETPFVPFSDTSDYQGTLFAPNSGN